MDLIICECGHVLSQHSRGSMGDVLLSEGNYSCGMYDCSCRKYKPRFLLPVQKSPGNKFLDVLSLITSIVICFVLSIKEANVTNFVLTVALCVLGAIGLRILWTLESN